MAKQKPTLSFWQIWNMSFGFLGIQFGFALQNGNVSRIFETLGAKIEDIPILWIAAPVTGLLIQPIIGHMSDKTWNRFGRRRPYFLIGAILSTIALLLMPNSPALWFAAGMLWIMDASINITMEPFRAFVGDMLSEKQRTTGFAMQSFFIGIGAFVASWLPYMMTEYLGISNTAPEGVIPDSVKFSFYAGGLVFLVAVLYTVFKTKEYSPEELESFQKESKSHSVNEESFTSSSIKSFFRKGILWISAGVVFILLVFLMNYKSELYILGGGLALFGLTQLYSAVAIRRGKVTSLLVQVVNDLSQMPVTMKQLAFVQFFSWFALFSMWIYTTSAIAQHLYHTIDPTTAAYNEAANWVSGMFGWYNLFAAGFAFLLPVMAKYTNRKITHSIALIIGGFSLASIYYLSDPTDLIFPMIGIGLAWSSILSMPYAILTGSLPVSKMGVYMGIFNFFIVIPQILAASILGFLVKQVFEGQAILALVLGGGSMVIAAMLSLFVKDSE